MRVFHLIDATRPAGATLDETLRACRLLAERTSHEHAFCLIGPAAAARRARGMGLGAVAAIAPPLGLPVLSWRLLRSLAPRLSPDVLHAWSGDMLEVSRLAFPARTPRVAIADGSPAPPTTALASRWLGVPLSSTILIAFSPCAREHAAARHDGLEAILVPPPAVPTPSHERDAALRRELGLSDHHAAVLLLGAPAHASAMRFAFLAGLLHHAGQPIASVLPRDTPQIARARRFRRGIISDLPFIVSDRSAADLSRACDIGVWDGGGPGPTVQWTPDPGAAVLPIVHAHAAGLPVVAPAWAAPAALYPPDAGACVALNGALPELARVLASIVQNAAARAELSRAVYRHAVGQDWPARFVAAVEHAWSRAAGTASARSFRAAS